MGAVEGGNHDMVENGDVHSMEGSGENHDMEHSDYYDMHDDDDHVKGEKDGWGAAAPNGYGPMGNYGMNKNRRDGKQGIVINNNVGGGCEMEGIAERIARKVVEMMMENHDYEKEMRDDDEDVKAETEKDAEKAKKEKKEKKDKKKNKTEE